MQTSKSDRTVLLLIANGFTFNGDGTINYPKNGQSLFNQNLILSLYIHKLIDRAGNSYKIASQTAATPQLVAA